MSKKEVLDKYDGIEYDFVGEILEDTKVIIGDILKGVSLGVCKIVPEFACSIIKKVKDGVIAKN